LLNKDGISAKSIGRVKSGHHAEAHRSDPFLTDSVKTLKGQHSAQLRSASRRIAPVATGTAFCAALESRTQFDQLMIKKWHPQLNRMSHGQTVQVCGGDECSGSLR
jgi:hypothetical protein